MRTERKGKEEARKGEGENDGDGVPITAPPPTTRGIGKVLCLTTGPYNLLYHFNDSTSNPTSMDHHLNRAEPLNPGLSH